MQATVVTANIFMVTDSTFLHKLLVGIHLSWVFTVFLLCWMPTGIDPIESNIIRER